MRKHAWFSLDDKRGLDFQKFCVWVLCFSGGLKFVFDARSFKRWKTTSLKNSVLCKFFVVTVRAPTEVQIRQPVAILFCSLKWVFFLIYPYYVSGYPVVCNFSPIAIHALFLTLVYNLGIFIGFLKWRYHCLFKKYLLQEFKSS